ncbi:MAG: 16S rRNA (uracil(1498)-N(3))-methyltransferase [Halieaceae bacterium]|nr:16S rRNA (uracil(1498)-N(3))-methyltransferase [Halieaceae bacterium]
MNLLLFSDLDRVGADRIRLTDHRLQHLREVIDANEGDSLRVGEINGRMGEAELVKLAPDEAVLDVALVRDPPPKLPLTLVLALPRPKMLRRILRMVAELGVESLQLINSYRVEKSYWQTPVLDPAVIEDYFLEGLSQSRDTVLPQLTLHKRFKPFVEDELPGLLAGRRGLLAHPGNYPPCPRSGGEPTLLVIGPEGGLIPYEVEKLEGAGCETVSLGPRILRVENAVTALVSQLS